MMRHHSSEENSQDQENQVTTEGCCSAEVKKTLCYISMILFIGICTAFLQEGIEQREHKDGWSPLINLIFNMIVDILAIAFVCDKASTLNKSIGKKFESGEWRTPCQRIGQLAAKVGIHSPVASDTAGETDSLLPDGDIERGHTSNPQYG